MPTSTSSSERPVPAGPWLRVVLLGVAVGAAGLAGLEGFWRAYGHRPTVIDDQDLWSYYRGRVDGDSGRTVVLVGSSRMQLDFSTREFRERFPGYRLLQLAIDDSHPVAVLRDLASDERFRGIVLCDISEFGLSRPAWESQQRYVTYYHRRSTLDRRWNARAAAWLQDRFALLSPQVDFLRLLRSRTVPPAFYLVTHQDRSREADYTMVDLARHRAERLRWLERAGGGGVRPLAPDAWLDQAMEVDALVRRIHQRGGRVAFIVFPSTGPSYEMTERLYPRAEYWNRFAARTAAVTLHFRDVPGLAGFDCPDTSHLDARDTPRFTAALAAELVRRGVLEMGE